MMQFVRRIIFALLLSGALLAGTATPTLADINPNENCVGVIASGGAPFSLGIVTLAQSQQIATTASTDCGTK